MKFTLKGRYAVQALVEIAYEDKTMPVALSEIALRENIPQNFLEQIFVKLRKAGIVTSLRGVKGGYILTKKPEEVFVLDILEAVNEPLQITRCQANSPKGCGLNHARCLTHFFWEDLSTHITGYLKQHSLADVIKTSTAQEKEVIRA